MTTPLKIFTRLFFLAAALAIFCAPGYSQEGSPDSPHASSASGSTPPEIERPKKMEFGFRYWVPSARASANVADNTTGVARLGVELDSQNASEVHYTWQFTRRNKLKVDYTQLMVRSGTADFTANLMGGPSISVNDIALDSLGTVDLTYRQVRIGYSWQGLRIGDRVKVGPLVETRGIVFNATYPTQLSFGDGSAGASTRDSGIFGLGMVTLGADATFTPHRRIVINVTNAFIPVAGLGRLLDSDTEMKFLLPKGLNLSTGYKYTRLRVSDGSRFADLKLRGPVFGVGFMF
ncbi:MAG TPA: hypothetical protein VJ302_31495 [Blastocatellia bacterium]|nr:hypothetical protein [Blastocatellia bacterium]